LMAPQSSAPDRFAMTIYTVQLKNILCQIDANVAKLHEWTPSLSVTGKTLLPVWHFRCR
jgi:hypothetical protein